MLSPIVFLFTLFSVHFSLTSASTKPYPPISILLPAFSKECLYHDIKSNDDSIVISYQVLTGGNFEIDFEIIGPEGNTITKETQKKYSDFLLKSFGLGQYTFCFTNSYGTALKKVEVTLDLEREYTEVKEEEPEDIIANNAVDEIVRNLNTVRKLLAYLRAREWRNMSTVSSTESRLIWLSILTMGVMIGISVLQSAVVQFFFKDRHRNYV